MKLLLLSTVFQGVMLVSVFAQDRVLREVLDEMSTTYQVHFSYDVKELETIKVTFGIVEKEPFQKAFERLIEANDLAFEEYHEGFFLISKERVLSAIIIDEVTQLPIDYAFIFVENSSISTTSDLSGTFQLEIGDLKQGELVITHLNYETKSIQITPIDDLSKTISIKAKNNNIAPIVVEAKRKNLKKRGRWEKRFKNAFLGQTKNSEFVEIENPEVIWFEEKKDILKAQAVDYLSIINYALGYKMRFYLNTFSLNKNNHIDYSGKVYFEDILEQMADKEKVKKNRSLTYINSKKYFFSALWAKNINEIAVTYSAKFGEYTIKKPFSFGFAQFMEEGKLLKFDKKNIKTLGIKRVGEYDIITTSDYFTFTNRAIFYEENLKKLGRKNAFANCFLKSSSGEIIFDKNGNIINAHEVEELGYWTEQRVANLLPLEYKYESNKN